VAGLVGAGRWFRKKKTCWNVEGVAKIAHRKGGGPSRSSFENGTRGFHWGRKKRHESAIEPKGNVPRHKGKGAVSYTSSSGTK